MGTTVQQQRDKANTAWPLRGEGDNFPMYYVSWDEVQEFKTHPVGTKSSNELGIYDMRGNVYEWCNDWHSNYISSVQTDPHGPSTGSYRVFRGSGWSAPARGVRASDRAYAPDYRAYILGFRLACSSK